MKKLKLFIIAAMSMTALNTSAQAIEEGNVIVDAYYGFPNLYSAVFRNAYVNGQELNVETSGLGPVGLRTEYLLTDKIGLGLDIGFNNTSVKFTDTYEQYNNTTGQYETVSYQNEFSTQKIGVMVTFNYHFIENDNLDFYGVFGAGYGNRTFKYESTDPNFTEQTVKGVFPVASRLGLGLRYFFTENLGANLGLGIGQGGLVNAGLSLKF